jgi:D-glycero-alpha-D-manno-heptose-7-phosphate kinase
MPARTAQLPPTLCHNSGMAPADHDTPHAVRARSPLRISFGGGGTDVSPYCDERGGAVLSATIDRYAYATLVPGGDRIAVQSVDYDVSVSYALDEEFVYDGQLDLAKAVIDRFRKEHGLSGGMSVLLHNDAPPGSGLGSSSAITVALVGALASHMKLDLDPYAIAELAYSIERVDAGIKGGRQDQYATTFGGFNFIEFEKGGAVVSPLRLRPETVYELEYRLVFAYVGGQHFSGRIIERQMANFSEGMTEAVDAMDRIKEIAHEMKRALLLGDVRALGGLLDEGWQEKKRMAEGVTNSRLDQVYDAAMSAGALGGKVSGAGGGGFMFFLTEPARRFCVQDALMQHDAEVVNFSFVQEGMRSWSV